MSGILSVGITGLRVAQGGLQTTSHNISNASTPGFNRQQTMQVNADSYFSGAGFYGQGANVTTVKRIYSEYLSNQVLGAENNVGELDAYLTQVKQIDNLLADSHAGLSPAMASFFQAVQQTAADPSSIPARQSLISTGQALASRFHGLDQRMAEIRDGLNTQLVAEVSLINSYATQIAEMNQRIVLAQASGTSHSANDLLDQRDQLVRDLNKEIRLTVVPQSDGTINTFVGSGQPLVVGLSTYTFVADTVSTEDPSRITVSMRAPNGYVVDMPESLLQGGTLGGLLKFRHESLDPAQNSLGKIANALAMNFNNQHKLGVDLQGFAGGNFFSFSPPEVLPNNANTGGATLTATQIASDYRLDVGSGSITRLSDGNVTPFSGFPTVIDGVTIDSSGGFLDGNDSFIIKPGNLATERVIPASTNLGNASVTSSASNLQSLTSPSSDYRMVVTSPTSIDFVRLTDNKVWRGIGGDVGSAFANLQDQLNADPQGFQLDFGGTPPAVADTFLIHPSRRGAADLRVVISDPTKLALASPFRTSASLTNLGVAKIDNGSLLAIDPTGAMGGIPLSGPVTVTYNEAANSLELTGGITATVNNFVRGQPNDINVAGLRFTISGTPANGDTFILETNANGISDNRNAIALGALQTKATLAGATATLQASYGQIVSFVGNRTREKQVTMDSQQTLAFQAEATRQQLSGVNLDEEAANLLRYQQAYQAAAKIMTTAGKMFDELLALGR